MQEWKKNIRQVVPYVPGEQPKEANVIKLNTNENPYPPSPKVKEQCAKICAKTEELRLYPDPTAGIDVYKRQDEKGTGAAITVQFVQIDYTVSWSAVNGTVKRCV